jgi:hypothetical protein
MPTISASVTSSGNDIRAAGTSISTTDTRFSAGWNAGFSTALRSAARFTLPIPQYATITACTLTLRASVSSSGTADTYLSFFNAVSPTFPSNFTDWNSRTLTTQVTWSITTAWGSAADFTSIDFSAALQDLINNGSWSSGSTAILDWRNVGTSGSFRDGDSFDRPSSVAPRLDITYSDPSSGGNPYYYYAQQG